MPQVLGCLDAHVHRDLMGVACRSSDHGALPRAASSGSDSNGCIAVLGSEGVAVR